MLSEWLPDVDPVVRYRRFMYEFEGQRNVQVGLRLFLAGIGLAFVAFLLFLWAYTIADSFYTWIEPAYALSMLAPPLVMLSIVVLLRPDRRMLKAGVVGVAITVLATIGFVWAYPYNWYHHGADYTAYVVGVYAIGMVAITVALGTSLKAHAPQLIRTLTEIRPPESYEPASTAENDRSSDGATGGSDSGRSDSRDSASVTVDGSSDADGATRVAATDRSDSGPAAVTLVVNGDRYTFGDGETFGRRNESWLDDLMAACGGHEEIPYVSSEHLEFTVRDDGVYVTDLSRNGTSLNGEDLDGGERKLSDGDTFVLADRAEIGVEL